MWLQMASNIPPEEVTPRQSNTCEIKNEPHNAPIHKENWPSLSRNFHSTTEIAGRKEKSNCVRRVQGNTAALLKSSRKEYVENLYETSVWYMKNDQDAGGEFSVCQVLNGNSFFCLSLRRAF
jgi:hypothetical protein